MITTRQQLEDWIKENGLTRWKFTKTDPLTLKEGERPNDCVADSTYYPGTIDEQIDITAKRLETYGQRVYATGYHSDKGTTGGMTEIAHLQPAATTPIYQQNVGTVGAADEATIAARVRKEVLAEIKEASYNDRLKELEARERAFEQEKSGMVGLLVEYSKPIIAALAGRNASARVGVLDQPGVTAEPITPVERDTEEDLFTDEEANELLDLMARFKSVEPDYMQMIRKVVEMAENGDAMYGAAKGFLTK